MLALPRVASAEDSTPGSSWHQMLVQHRRLARREPCGCSPSRCISAAAADSRLLRTCLNRSAKVVPGSSSVPRCATGATPSASASAARATRCAATKRRLASSSSWCRDQVRSRTKCRSNRASCTATTWWPVQEGAGRSTAWCSPVDGATCAMPSGFAAHDTALSSRGRGRHARQPCIVKLIHASAKITKAGGKAGHP